MAAPAAPRIFVSYARSDGADLAREIQRMLQEDHELPVWRDLADLEGTDAWWPQVREAIDQVDHMVLIMTERALRSEYVQREWRYARRVGTCVIPIQAEEGQSFQGLPPWMARHNFVAWWDNDSWRRLVHTLERDCRATRVPFMVGDLPEDYVERPDEFYQLRAQLLDFNRGQPIAVTTALKGAGGFGKTTLAKALCHDDEVRDAFADGILWLTLGQTPSEADRVENIRDLVEALTDERPGFAKLDAAAAELAGVLADREALIVVDDAWRRADLEPFLQGGPECARLITTRMTDVLPRESKPVQVDAMQPNQASALLRYDLPDGEDAALAALAGRLGEWPLLLKLANGVLHFRVVEAGETLADAIAYANDALDEAGLTAFDPDNAEQRDQAAAASIGASMSLLGENERARFEELGVFAEDAQVPLNLVAAIWKGTGGLSRVQSERLWLRLFQASLILRLDLKARRLQLHDVVRAYLQGVRKDQLPALHAAVVDAYRTQCPDGWHTGPDDGYFFQHLPWHLREAKQAEELQKLLFDYSWLRSKLEAVGLPRLIEDFEQLGTDEQARKMAAGLRLSAHGLAEDPRQLASQLLGRFAADDGPEIASLLTSCRDNSDRPAMLPLRPTLVPPGAGLIRILAGHAGEVHAITGLPQRGQALSAGNDGTVRLWDLESGQEVQRFTGHSGWVGTVATLPERGAALSAGEDGTLRLWDLANGQEMQRFVGHDGPVEAVVALPERGQALSAGQDGTLRLWDLASGREMQRFDGDRARICGLAALPGRQALLAESDGTVRLWDLETGQEVQRFAGHSDFVAAVVALPKRGQALSASFDGTVRLWELESGQEVQRFTGHSGGVNAVAALPVLGQVLSAGSDGTVRLWDLNSGQEVQRFAGHSSGVWAVAALPERGQALSAGTDGTVRLWDITSSQEMPRFAGHSGRVNSVAALPDGKRALAGFDDGTVRLWDLESGQEVERFTGHSARVNAVVALPDGKRALAGFDDGTVRLWDLETGQELRRFGSPRGGINAMAALPDGHGVIGCSFGIAQLWDLASGREVQRYSGHQDALTSVVVLPDGKRALTGSDDGTARLWDLTSGKELQRFWSHGDFVCAVAALPDGQQAITSSFQVAQLWDLTSGKEVRRFAAHRGEARAWAVLSEGGQALSAGDDGTVRLWDLVSGAQLAAFTGDAEFSCCAITPDGRFAVAGDDAGRIHVLEILL